MAFAEKISDDDFPKRPNLEALPESQADKVSHRPLHGSLDWFVDWYLQYRDAPDAVRRPEFMRMKIKLDEVPQIRRRFLNLFPDFRV